MTLIDIFQRPPCTTAQALNAPGRRLFHCSSCLRAAHLFLALIDRLRGRLRGSAAEHAVDNGGGVQPAASRLVACSPNAARTKLDM